MTKQKIKSLHSEYKISFKSCVATYNNFKVTYYLLKLYLNNKYTLCENFITLIKYSFYRMNCLIVIIVYNNFYAICITGLIGKILNYDCCFTNYTSCPNCI